MSPAFLVTSLAIVATPGTGVVLTVAAGLRSGRRVAVITALGCTLGIVPHLAAAVTGTAALLRAGGLAFEGLKIAGVCYLLSMAWVTWRDHGILAVDEGAPRASTGRTIRTAVLANLLNPKLTLFFFAFLPQFVDQRGAGATPRMVELGGLFMAMTLVVFIGYGVFASYLRRHLIDRPRAVRRLQRFFSLSYLGLGAKLATTHR